MKVAVITSRIFRNTRAFLKRIASRTSLRLARDGLAPLDELASWADVMWFDGLGASFRLLACGAVASGPRIVLRLASDQLRDIGPLLDIEPLGDLIVPGDADAGRVARLRDGPLPFRLHVIDDAPPVPRDLDLMTEVLLTPSGTPLASTWEAFLHVARLCESPCAVVGAPASGVHDLCDFLRRGFAIDATGFDRVSFVKAPSRFKSVVLFDVPSPGEDPDDLVRDAASRLDPAGALVVLQEVRSRPPGESEDAALDAMNRLLPAGLPRLRVRPVGRRWLLAANARRKPRPIVLPRASRARDEPLASVLIPVWNDEARIGPAIESILTGAYANFEIVVVDDGSTDSTADVVKSFDDPRVRYLYKEHSGRPETRNLAVRLARGDLLAWLDSDDLALPNRLRAQVDLFLEDPSLGIVFSGGFFLDENARPREVRLYRDFDPRRLPALLLEGTAGVCPILNSASMIRKQCYDLVGLYDSSFLRAQDYEFFVRCAANPSIRFRRLDVPLILVSVRSKPSAQTIELKLAGYRRLIDRIFDIFPLELLFPELVCQLRSEAAGRAADLALARTLLSMALAFEAPPSHAVFTEAIDLLTGVARRCASATAWNLLGIAASYGGRLDRARSAFKRALEIAPGNADARRNLIQCAAS